MEELNTVRDLVMKYLEQEGITSECIDGLHYTHRMRIKKGTPEELLNGFMNYKQYLLHYIRTTIAQYDRKCDGKRYAGYCLNFEEDVTNGGNGMVTLCLDYMIPSETDLEMSEDASYWNKFINRYVKESVVEHWKKDMEGLPYDYYGTRKFVCSFNRYENDFLKRMRIVREICDIVHLMITNSFHNSLKKNYYLECEDHGNAVIVYLNLKEME